MDITFKGRRTEVQERFRAHAESKLSKIEKLDHKAIRIDVEVSQERNPRLSDQRERVELTIRSAGPVIRAEAAADDRYAALDLALAKLEARLRRSAERRKARRVAHLPGKAAASSPAGKSAEHAASVAPSSPAPSSPEPVPEQVMPEATEASVVPIQMEGEGPLVVREKFHTATPMSISQALQEMELVGHDFYLFRDEECGHPSVVYRRRGYQYGLIRLVEGNGKAPAGAPGWVGTGATGWGPGTGQEALSGWNTAAGTPGEPGWGHSPTRAEAPDWGAGPAPGKTAGPAPGKTAGPAPGKTAGPAPGKTAGRP